MANTYDLFIIGGGINGCGIARDASGRGLSVFLCEQGDLAEQTSSRSTKLIHGGLRYLEYNEFRLVRKALAEREVLLTIAPHLVHPLQFIIPHDERLRPRWLIRLGLWLYDHLGQSWNWRKKSLIPHSASVNAQKNIACFSPLNPMFTHGFSYYDCRVDDARLVIVNAIAARDQGAIICTHTKFISATRNNNLWHCLIEDQQGNTLTVIAKAIINASGPWVDKIIDGGLPIKTQHHIKLVKGSHIVVPKLYEGEHAYLLQNDDKRIIFTIPYQEKFTIIGTTDIEYQGDPASPIITVEERVYLCNIINHYFKNSVTSEHIVYEWSGVRPLQADDANNPSAVTRDYFLEIEDENGSAPVLSVFGGKITTYRELAEHAMDKLAAYFSHLPKGQTANHTLPGGNIGKPENYIKSLTDKYPHLPISLLSRLMMTYGSNAEIILQGIEIIDDLGIYFGGDLYQCEIDYLVNHEWAKTADDILWRRTKLGLTQTIDKNTLITYLAHH